MSKMMDALFPNRRIKYRKNGDVDYRCQAGRDLKADFDAADRQEEFDANHRTQIIQQWQSMDAVDRSQHVLCNSKTYRLYQYVTTVPIEDQMLYYNSEGELVGRQIDTTINNYNNYKVSDFMKFIKK